MTQELGTMVEEIEKEINKLRSRVELLEAHVRTGSLKLAMSEAELNWVKRKLEQLNSFTLRS